MFLLALIVAGLLFASSAPAWALSAPITVRLDPQKVLRHVPELRGIHMAPLKDPYQEEDVIRLKAIGARCVRFGFSALILEDEENPGQYKEAGFQYLDNFVAWCEKHSLPAILDMHHAIGRRKWEDTRIWKHYFGSKDPREYQDRFVNLWREIALRFAHRGGVAAYELLNEPNPPDDDFAVWNDLARRATAAIREFDQNHPIIVDSIGCANPSKFTGLIPIGDPNIIYSFHNYEPHDYHQQKRPWSFSVNGDTYYYPGIIKGTYWNRRRVRAVFAPPVRFAQNHNVRLFCGEFGCVSDCPPMTDMIYLMDQISLFHELGIGWTMFNYIQRESKPYWKSHFDCNLFIYFVPESRLYTFERKLNLIRFFLEKEGDVLALDQPSDEDVTLYGVREPHGRISVLVSNKDREAQKRFRLELTGFDHAPLGFLSIMDETTQSFEPMGPLDLESDRCELTLPKLSIARLDLLPAHADTAQDETTNQNCPRVLWGAESLTNNGGN